MEMATAKEQVFGEEVTKPVFIMPPISAKELVENDYPEPQFLIENMLPIGLNLLAGRPKIGKSFMALQIAVAIGTGGVFLGESTSKGSVAYIAFEDSDGRLATRLKKMVDAEQAPDIAFYPHEMARGEFDHLNKKIGKLGSLADTYDLIIVDTLSQAIHVDYNDNNALTKALAPIQEIALDAETSILFVDHLRKPNWRSNYGLSEVRGGTAKIAVADSIWGLYEESNSKFLEIIGRDIEEKRFQVAFDTDSFVWSLSNEIPEKQQSQQKEQILEFLEGKEATNLEIAQSIGKDKGNIHKVLGSLLIEGQLERKKAGNQYLYYKAGEKE